MACKTKSLLLKKTLHSHIYTPISHLHQPITAHHCCMPCLQKDAVYIHSSMRTYVWGLMRFTVKVAKNYIILTGYIIMRRFTVSHCNISPLSHSFYIYLCMNPTHDKKPLATGKG